MDFHTLNFWAILVAALSCISDWRSLVFTESYWAARGSRRTDFLSEEPGAIPGYS